MTTRSRPALSFRGLATHSPRQRLTTQSSYTNGGNLEFTSSSDRSVWSGCNLHTSKSITGVDNPQPARTGFQGVGNPQPAAAVDNPEPANEACLWHCPSSLNEATGYTYAAHASETCSIPRAGTRNNRTKHTISYNRSSHSAGPIIDARRQLSIIGRIAAIGTFLIQAILRVLSGVFM